MNIVPEQAHEESVEALLAFTVDKRQRNAEAASPGMFWIISVNKKFQQNFFKTKSRITERSIIVKYSATGTSDTVTDSKRVSFNTKDFVDILMTTDGDLLHRASRFSPIRILMSL